MSSNILIIAAPFGFGPASKALILAHGLSSGAKVTINAVGDSLQFVHKHKRADISVVVGRFSETFSTRNSLSPYDIIISVNHIPALQIIDKYGLKGRTVVIDSLYEWRRGQTQTLPGWGGLAYLVQDYFGMRLSHVSKNMRVVAPIIWPFSKKKLATENRPITLHFGGLTSPLASWERLSQPVIGIISNVHKLCQKYDRNLIVIGNELLTRFYSDISAGLTILGNISPAETVELIASSEMLLTTPGIGAIYEAMYSDVNVVLLPPTNSTQLFHFQVLTSLGIPSFLPRDQVTKLVSENLGLGMEAQTLNCLRTLQQSNEVYLSGAEAVLKSLLADENSGKEMDALVGRQRELFQSLSKLDAVETIKNLIAERKPDVTLKSSKARQQLSLSDYLQKLPKVQHHLHLEGSIRPELMLKMAERNRLKLPFSTVLEHRRLLQYQNFDDFARALLLGVYCLRTEQDFYELVCDIGVQLRKENTIYADVTWTPQFYLNRRCSLDDILNAMNKARGAVLQKCGVIIRWIPDLVRSYPDHAWRIVEWVRSRASDSDGIAALGLGGPELAKPSDFFTEHFRHARESGLHANPHAGEGDGPISVNLTLDCLSPRRIGHGVRAVEDKTVLERIRRENILLEICPTSNIRLGLYSSYGDHPLKEISEYGCKYSINSDDPVLFGTTISNEYRHAVIDCGLTLGDLKQSIITAAEAAYLQPSQINKLVDFLKYSTQKLDSEYYCDSL